MKRFLSTLAAVLLTTSAAWAQGYPDIWTSEVEPSLQGANKMKGFTFGVRVETWRADLSITDSSPSTLEDSLDEPQVLHTAMMFSGSYDIQVGPKLTITIFAGAGPEYIATRADVGPTTGALDSTFDYHLAFEVGSQVTAQADRLDFGGGLLIRSGTEAEVESSDNLDQTYHYFMFRVQGEVGYRFMDTVRAYGGLRYSLYSAQWEDDNAAVDFDAEFEVPIGLFLGVELGTGPARGRFEASVLDAYGFLAAITWTF